MQNIRIKFVPYEKFKEIGIEKLLRDLQQNMIVLIDAKLKTSEEMKVIEHTMLNISDNFTGVELSSLDFAKAKSGLGKIKNSLLETILGKKRGMTILGPATIVHRIKKNPEDLLLYVG